MPKDEEKVIEIYEAVGLNLQTDNNKQSQELISFLSAVFEGHFNFQLKTATDLGYLWSIFIGYIEDRPEDPVTLEFATLNKAWNESYTTL